MELLVGVFLCIYITHFNKLGKKQVYICNYEDSFLHIEISVHSSLKNILKRKAILQDISAGEMQGEQNSHF